MHEETAPSILCVGGWVSPRAGLEVMEKEIYPCQEWNPDSSVVQHIA
jgi:hypothetical protein